MRNKEIADLLNRMGALLELKGEIIFKIRAYYKAAENINNLSEDIQAVAQEGRLGDIPGVGKAVEQKIKDYLATGKVPAYEKLIKEIPETLLDVMNIPSVGPKKAKLFFDELKIKNIDDLQKAAQQGTLLTLPSVKEKTVENILKGIDVVRQGQSRMNLGKATDIADGIVQTLKNLPGVKKISLAGSLRRGCETVGDIDILVDAKNPKKIMDAFVSLPQVKSVNAHGDTKSSILTQANVQVDLRVVDSESFGAALMYFTGSKSFNIKIRQVAQKKKMKVNEYGVFKVNGKSEKSVAGKSEEDCFKALGLPYICPELREEMGEKALFGAGKIPVLIEQNDIQGELHVHSTYSDGRNTIEEMAVAAQKRGYKYLAISDHSARLKVARGVSPADLKKKRKEIDQLNKKFKDFRILFGSEVEIDMDGNLDYNDEILSGFDVVIGAIHSGFEQSSAQLTKRLVKACQNKRVNLIAHPMGGHIGKREPYSVDFTEVCKAAADHNVFLEINAFPVRLDLNSSNVYFAKKQGVKFVINTDSHRVEHMDYMKLGISIARRGWLTKKDVLNTLPVTQLLKTLKK